MHGGDGKARTGATRAMRWARRVTAAFVVLTLLLAGGVLYLRRDRGSTAVSVDEALDRFRRESGAEASPPSSVDETLSPTLQHPAEGIYIYTTTGSTATNALGGAEYRYPPETTVTVARTGCGSVARWAPLRERWSESHTCIQGERELLMSITQFREFFGQADTTSFECAETSPRPSVEAPAAGTTTESTCVSGADVATILYTVTGSEVIDVRGQPVETLRTTVEITIDGSSLSGHSVQERWLVYGTGLLVREQSSSTGSKKVGPFTVDVTEDYDLQIQSLTPSR